MLKRSLATIGLLIFLFSGLFAQNDSQINDLIENLPYEELNEQELNSLMQMREEEKLAHDVYITLYNKWQINVFKNIAKSEQTHTDMVAILIKKYNLVDPYNDQAGVFSDTTLQKLYNDLVNIGSESMVKAIFIGCTIEDLDIYDLEEFLAQSDNQDIKTVYQNLMNGSRNHMRSFNDLYTAQGETYQAQYITNDEFDQIVNSASEQGFLDADGQPTDFSSENEQQLQNDYIMNLPREELSEQELGGLLQMREEEKLARDVYWALYDQWNLTIFKNIAASEQTHTDMVALLLQKYNLNDPFIEERGTFTDSTLRQLYNDLVTIGSESAAKGLFIGCTIEDLDIFDLEKFIVEADNQDIKTVYQNLMKGSRNHLRSFNMLYNMQDSTYQTQYITNDEFEQIINSETEKGFLDADGNPYTLTSVADFSNTFNLPKTIKLAQNYPNPFNPQTTIQFDLAKQSLVSLNVYDIRGRLVKVLANNITLSAGVHSIVWDGKDESGNVVGSGVYLYRIDSGNISTINQMILLK